MMIMVGIVKNQNGEYWFVGILFCFGDKIRENFFTYILKKRAFSTQLNKIKIMIKEKMSWDVIGKACLDDF